ncbi:MAG: hypothetical protein AAF997_09765 [Myxococcota bacterium]
MPRPRIREQRRAEILAAFESCAARHGLANTTLVRVAEESGHPRSLVRYFLGNRGDMVASLIENILKRGEAQFDAFRSARSSIASGDLIDLLMDEILANAISNKIIVQLWDLASRDDEVKARVASLYGRVQNELVSQLADEGIGDGKSEREDAAYAAMSLAIGSSVLKSLGLAPRDPARIRNYARSLLPSRG